MGSFHRADMVVWFFKADWVWSCSMTRNCIPRRSCVGCISIFVEVLGSWSVLWLLWRSCYLDDFSLWTMVIWRDKFLVYHNFSLIILLCLCCWVHIKYSLRSGMGLMRSWEYFSGDLKSGHLMISAEGWSLLFLVPGVTIFHLEPSHAMHVRKSKDWKLS